MEVLPFSLEDGSNPMERISKRSHDQLQALLSVYFKWISVKLKLKSCRRIVLVALTVSRVHTSPAAYQISITEILSEMFSEI